MSWPARLSLPLRWLLLAPALAILLVVLGAATWVAYHAAARSILRLERQVTGEVASLIEHQVLEELGQPVRFATRLRDGLQRGLLRLEDDEQLRRFLLNELRQNPSLGFAAVARLDGSLIGISRDPTTDAAQVLLAGPASGAPVLRSFALMAADDSAGELLQTTQPYDARERPWFQRALNERRMGWYPVFVYRAQSSLGMGVSAPVLEAETQRFLGALAVDVTLARFSQFLAQEFSAREGLAFVAEPDGQLLATSLPNTAETGQGAALMGRRHLSQSSDARLRAMPELLGEDVREGQRFVRLDGHGYLLDVRRVRDAAGLDLLQGVLLAESEFAGSMWQQARGAAFAVLGIAIVGTLLLLAVLRLVQNRVAAVGESAERFAAGDRSARASEAGPVREVQLLARQLNRLGDELQQSLTGLEAEVARRTTELEAANEQLELLASLDGLTHVANRRTFDEQMQLAWRRCQREHQPLAMLLIDVDDFKRYNDRYGHPAGDAVLQRVAATLQGLQRRADDLAARYGGEEFALLLPRVDEAGAERVAQRVVSALRSLALPHETARATAFVTVSVGVALARPQADDRPATGVAALVAEADAALYAAKEAGRNRVQLACNPGSASSDRPSSIFRDTK